VVPGWPLATRIGSGKISYRLFARTSTQFGGKLRTDVVPIASVSLKSASKRSSASQRERESRNAGPGPSALLFRGTALCYLQCFHPMLSLSPKIARYWIDARFALPLTYYDFVGFGPSRPIP